MGLPQRTASGELFEACGRCTSRSSAASLVADSAGWPAGLSADVDVVYCSYPFHALKLTWAVYKWDVPGKASFCTLLQIETVFSVAPWQLYSGYIFGFFTS